MMKALILTLLSLTAVMQAWARSTPADVPRMQGQVCIECSVTPNGSSVELIREIRNAVNASLSIEDIFNANKDLNFSQRCENFAGNESLGKWGEFIVTEMDPALYPQLYRGTDDLREVCPAWNSLPDRDKEFVWVMILNAMAHLESSCGKSETAQGPNGTLKGLLQLHKGRESIYAKGCRKGDASTPENTLRCGLAMLDGQLYRDDALFSRRSYWDVLRPQASSQKFKKVKQAISNLSVCK